MGWKRLDRSAIYDSPYMKVWEDKVEMSSGVVVDDYSVVDLPDGVTVIATDKDNNMLLFNEYKYAVDDYVLTFPAGGIDAGETPEQAAKKELLEETGYSSDEVEVITSLYPYPSKITHTNYMVRVKNAVRVSEVTHTEMEADTIGELRLVPLSQLKSLREAGKLNTSYMLAAMAIAFPEYF